MEIAGRTNEFATRQALRASAVRAVHDGQRTADVARRFNISRQTLRNWVARHRDGGAQALADRPKGRAPRRMLLPWQDALVAGAVRVLHPGVVDPRHTWWTRGAIAEYIRRSFDIPFKAWQVDSHLRGWGFASYREARRACVVRPSGGAAPVLTQQPPAGSFVQAVSSTQGESAGAVQQLR